MTPKKPYYLRQGECWSESTHHGGEVRSYAMVETPHRHFLWLCLVHYEQINDGSLTPTKGEKEGGPK